jgi:hypothetical protein
VEICFYQIITGEPPGSMLFENQARKNVGVQSEKHALYVSDSECRIC